MIELIPAIDIIDGKCVRLSQGDYDSKKVYNENPVEVAKELEAHGIRRLHVVDLDGAVSHHVVNYRTLEQIASRTSWPTKIFHQLLTNAVGQTQPCKTYYHQMECSENLLLYPDLFLIYGHRKEYLLALCNP